MYKIYVLLDPNTEEVMYVGKTSNKRLNDRLCSHLCEAKKLGKKNKRCAWLKSLINKNLKPIILEIENLPTLKEANDREIFWISHYRNINPNLKNTTPGGDGQPKGYDFKNRFKPLKGQKVKAFEEYLKNGGNKGKKTSKETLEKFSKTRTGKPQPNIRKEILVEDIITGNIECLLGYQLVMDKYNIDKGNLAHYLNGNKKFYFKNRYNFYHQNKRKELIKKKSIIATNSNEILHFLSVIGCANYFKIDRRKIYGYIKSGIELEGYTICQID